MSEETTAHEDARKQHTRTGGWYKIFIDLFEYVRQRKPLFYFAMGMLTALLLVSAAKIIAVVLLVSLFVMMVLIFTSRPAVDRRRNDEDQRPF